MGKAGRSKLNDEQRKERARNAATARWKAQRETASLPVATHGSEGHPLLIGNVALDCYVLEDKRRILTQGAMQQAVGLAAGGSMEAGMNRLELFVNRKGIGPYVPESIKQAFSNPVRFITPAGARANGFEAEHLVELCEAVLSARDEGVLQKQQENIARSCEMLVRGFARVGLVALIDEATGYQRDREATALARILTAFIAEELQPWIKTFPSEFYEQMFRLRGLEFKASNPNARPGVFGHFTNEIVYRRLAPGVLAELRKVTPRNEKGKPKAKLFQSLTPNAGYSKLKEHLGAVVALMKISDNWEDFMLILNKHYPAFGDTIQLPFEE